MSGGLHHVELWVPDLAGSRMPWGWLLGELGRQPFQDWPAGVSWRHGDVYLVMEQSPALSGPAHDRRAPGLNHLAFTVDGPGEVERLARAAPGHGWSELFPEQRPDAAYLEDAWGYEVELQSGPPG